MKILRIALIFLIPCVASGQPKNNRLLRTKKVDATICFMKQGDAHTLVPAPEIYHRIKSSNGRVKATANIEVEYQGFSPEAKAAFESAVEIWESLLASDVTIHVLARWAPLGTNVLGGASPGTYIANFDGAPRAGVWYPVSLAEKLARRDLNEVTEPDIVATFNSSNTNWHFGIADVPPSGKYDLISIVLHEIGHGLGITHAYTVEGTQGQIGSGFGGRPVIYETNVETQTGDNLVVNFQQPSAELGAQLTSQSLFYNSPLVKNGNSNTRATIYAPATYSAGSSIAHLDDDTYPVGNINALMTPFINPAERALDPGPIAMGILRDIGWINTHIQHTPLIGTENTTIPYEVKCTLVSDNGYDAESVKLFYTLNSVDFTEVAMTPTGTANEFSAFIPAAQAKFGYYLSVKDNEQRTLTKPGVLYRHGMATDQSLFEFETGPDSKAPFINHVPKAFITNTDPLKIEAVISDNTGILEAFVEYKINGLDQPMENMTLVVGTDSTYVKEILFASGSLVPEDFIEYRIRAKDNAAAGNERFAPASGYYKVAIAGLSPTEDFYQNDFNSSSDDFFGNGFSIVTPTGFTNGALHTDHPYQEGNGAPGDARELIYQLKVPIRIQAQNPILKFDEIVLVEPGESGSAFGEADFFDYVVVEGSTDGGSTWVPAADGYDSRDFSQWLTRYNSALAGGTSNAVGDPGLYRSRTINLLNKFSIGDEVAFRFRLYSDPFAVGWGWAIDNLNIQNDDVAPVIQHQHVDFLLTSATKLEVNVKAADASGLQQLAVEYKLNDEALSTVEYLIDPNTNVYSLDLAVASPRTATDNLFYRVKAIDKAGNSSTYPSNDFIKVAFVQLSPSVSSFVTDFNEGVPDVTGNFFSVLQPTGFSNKAMHSQHPYLVGSSLGQTSDFTWLVRKPVKVDEGNPYISFDEIVFMDYEGSAAKDYVIVEASKDGVTWEALEESYGTLRHAVWKSNFDNQIDPGSSLFKNHRIKITENGKFVNNDQLLIRFRMFSDAATTGWGWAVDNLSIQGPITAVEDENDLDWLSAYPNPATDVLRINVSREAAQRSMKVQILSAHGQLVLSEHVPAGTSEVVRDIPVSQWTPGIYFVKVSSGPDTKIKKVAIVR